MALRVFHLLPAIWVVCLSTVSAQEDRPAGLALTFVGTAQNSPGSDTIVAPNVWLHVDTGDSPSPFLGTGPFTATWNGFLSVDLRSIYTFQAEVNGHLRLEVNGREVLDVTGDGGLTEAGVRVRLNKGPNEVKAHYAPAAGGAPHVRLFWASRDGLPQLIPQSAWSHAIDDSLQTSARRHRGRELVIEHRCVQCHDLAGGTIDELRQDAPDFTGIGSRRRSTWIRQLLSAPAPARADLRMPRMFHADEASHAAEAVAAFLATLTDPESDPAPRSKSPSAAAEGGRLFSELHCVACHTSPEVTAPSDGISLRHVANKFTSGALARFLRNPAKHFRSTRMPDFRLNDDESGAIAAFLLAHADPVAEETTPRAGLASQGRDLVQTRGCLNCHAAPLENRFQARPLEGLSDWTTGCLSTTPMPGSSIPFFSFSEADRQALREFAGVGFASLRRQVNAEFARRQVANLNCAGCHNHQIEAVPPLDLLGAKLKPEYATAIIGGKAPAKPRPWIKARMPGFATRAGDLAKGMANLHGFPASTPAEAPIDAALADTGFKLIQSDGGFSCVSCHAIGQFAATQISETIGINFALANERLQRDYFIRWLRNPLAVDPTTRMPAFFDESGQSQLDLLDRDSTRQIEAMWEYLRGGPGMRIPPDLKQAQQRPRDQR